jgi:hypothetical protein
MNTRVLRGFRHPRGSHPNSAAVMILDVSYVPLRWTARSRQRSCPPAIAAKPQPTLHTVQSTYALERRYFL